MKITKCKICGKNPNNVFTVNYDTVSNLNVLYLIIECRTSSCPVGKKEKKLGPSVHGIEEMIERYEALINEWNELMK